MIKTWQLQEAKNRLSKVIDNALSQGFQVITRHGEPTAVVLSMEQFNKLRACQTKLTDFFSASPLCGIELDLERNKDLPRDTSL